MFVKSQVMHLARVAAGLFAAVLLSSVLLASQPPAAVSAGDPVIAGAGDIACDPANPNYNGGNGTATNCRMKATSDLMLNMNLSGVFILGDNQMEDGTLSKFLQSYDPTWGRLKSITHPAVGNHDYLTADASGYYTYFGAAAGDPNKGYYSYDLGAWHLIVLNSNCSKVGGCGFGSPQEQWLKADLAAHPNVCTLAYWHHPRFSSGQWGNQPQYDAFWRDLYAAHVDLTMHGHDHHYERFALQNPDGVADPNGIREFVVGTGGNNHTPWTTVQPNSEVRNNNTYGVLKLTLHPASYEWTFVPEAGKTFTDSGSTPCHNTGGAVPPTGTATVTPTADAYVNSSSPSTNYGSSSQLRVDGSPVVKSYLRFAVQGLSGPVVKATLRVYANSSLSGGYSAYRVADNAWSERTINAGNAPPLSSLIGTSGQVAAGTWTSVDVTSYVTGNGTFSLALASTNATALSLASRESANAPRLVVETGTSALPTLTPISTSTPAPPPSGSTATFVAAADAFVYQSYPATNYGSAPQLRVDGSPIMRSFVRFNVQGLSGTVAKATLRIYANSSSSSGYAVRGAGDSNWGESTINYGNAPAVAAVATGASGGFGAGVWTSVDVTPLVTGNGTFTFALTTSGATQVSLASRESGANAPRLVITTR
jgi:hypothetical protein